tara:strand:+ start:4518 stop:6242 length:1725 start_codon:yes stop_codon:yes gene_type:complete
MIIKKIFLFFLLNTFYFISCQAQNIIFSNSQFDSINLIHKSLIQKNQTDSFEISITKFGERIKNSKYEKGKINHYLILSRLSFNFGDFENAFINSSQALEMSKKIKSYNLINSSYSWKINILEKTKSLDLKKTIDESMNFIKKNDFEILTKRYLTLSSLNRNEDRIGVASSLLDSAIIFAEKSNLPLLQIKTLRGKAILKIQTDPNSALKLFKKALNKSKKNQNKHLLIESYFNLGKCYSILGRSDSSINNMQNALEIALDNNKNANITIILKALAEEKFKSKDFKKAYQTLTLKDSIQNIKLNNKDLLKVKNLALKLKSTESQLKLQKTNSDRMSLILLIFIVFTAAYIYFSKYRKFKNSLLKNKNAFKAISEQEEEIKQKIGEELHDNIGGSLAALKMRLSELNDPNYYQSLSNEINNLEVIYDDVRKLSSNLSVNPHIHESLYEKIQNLCENTFHHNYSISINFFPESQMKLNFNSQLTINCIRILQEIFTNIIKHSNAKNINLDITNHPDFISIIVSDDGSGFNTKKYKAGNGLENIKKRASLFNGEVLIESKLKEGTSIIVNLSNQDLA